jgi:membrane-associated phospholipid phosphatase
MKKELAESFSLSFHPILIAFYSLVFVFVLPIFEIQSLGSQFAISIMIMAFVTTVLLPIFSIFMLKRQNIISSIRIEKREQRLIPYLLIFSYYSITAYMIYRIDFVPILIPLLFAIPAISAIILALFNTMLKVSAHALSIASVNTMLVVLMYYYDLKLLVPVIVTFILSIIVVISRYYLKAHTWLELILGYFLGVLISGSVGYYVLFHGF